MKLQTRLFDLGIKRYGSLGKLAKAMQMDASTLSRVRSGQIGISGKFIGAALQAMPGYGWHDLFFLDTGVQGCTDGQESSVQTRKATPAA